MSLTNHCRQMKGMTLVETLIASSIMFYVLATLLIIGLMVSREQKLQSASELVTQKTNLLQDRLVKLLREMSQAEGVIFGNQVSGQNRYRMIYLGRGPAPVFAREQFLYEPASYKLTYDPNTSVANDQQVLFQSQKGARLLELAFYPSLNVGRIPDNATLNVMMQVGDDGMTGRRAANGSLFTNVFTRYFTVRMRNR
jgi:hypothetical protein